jgi:N-acetyl-gamma-glutamyl-phosphate reductase
MYAYSFPVHKIPVGVLGASGYAGRELCALITRHPRLALQFASANERRGERARLGGTEVRFIAHDEAQLESCALVFSALPHGASAPWVGRARDAGVKAVDLSSDLRPGNAPTSDVSAPSGVTGRNHGGMETSHGAQPSGSATAEIATASTQSVPYGLTELYRGEIATADVVANPGCYPTAILLALAPLAERGLIAAGSTISVSAASGVTGAGYTPRADLLFGEVVEDFRAYAVGNTHRHLPEITTTLSRLGSRGDLVFTPHLLPVARGILATITVTLTERLADPNEVWRRRFEREPFIEITEELPSLRDVVRRNVVRISATVAANVQTPTLVVFAAIDNLVKGAAGQALQNANLMLGLAETEGLPS